MRLVLDLVFLLGLVLTSPWLIYHTIRTNGWRDLPERLGFIAPPAANVWLHGSSVGEVRLIEPLVRLLERQGLSLAISSHTVTGVSAARLTYPKHVVFRFPLDFSFVQRRLMARLDPDLVVIVESDLWPNHLLAAEQLGVGVAVVNAKLSERSLRLHRWTRIIPRALRGVALVAAQTEAHAESFRLLGVPEENIAVTGNMKYDLTTEQSEPAERANFRNELGFAGDACIVIGGSLHPGEDEDLLAAFRHAADADSGKKTRLVLVPRYPDQAPAVINKVARAGLSVVARSALAGNPGRGLADGEVVVVDTLGELRRFYSVADIAFVGGSLYFRGSNKGGHNLMEPAILGLPVLFGPYNFSFRETVADLLAAGAGIMVHDRDELGAALAELVASRTKRVEIGQRARQVVIAGQGASERNMALLKAILDSNISCSTNPQEAQCRHQSQTHTVNE
jgi:3-deoxy-D-manno-octulosonic-acid transferase